MMHCLVYVDRATRLGAVRWTIAGPFEESIRKRVRQTGQFWIRQDTPCKLHESISQLAGSSRKLALSLIF